MPVSFIVIVVVVVIIDTGFAKVLRIVVVIMIVITMLDLLVLIRLFADDEKKDSILIQLILWNELRMGDSIIILLSIKFVSSDDIRI